MARGRPRNATKGLPRVQDQRKQVWVLEPTQNRIDLYKVKIGASSHDAAIMDAITKADALEPVPAGDDAKG